MATTSLVGNGLAAAQLAQEELAAAQEELDRHLPIRRDGRCACCREVAPCPGRQAAGEVFVRYGRLPRRRPGLAGVRTGAQSRPRADS